MLRENGTTRLNVAPSRSSAQDDPFLTAVKEAAAADFTVLGEIGRGEGGVIMYLARDMESSRSRSCAISTTRCRRPTAIA